jgi:hypothetical protein
MIDPLHVADGILPQRWAKFMDVSDMRSIIHESELEDEVDTIMGSGFGSPSVVTKIKRNLGDIVKMAAVE